MRHNILDLNTLSQRLLVLNKFEYMCVMHTRTRIRTTTAIAIYCLLEPSNPIGTWSGWTPPPLTACNALSADTSFGGTVTTLFTLKSLEIATTDRCGSAVHRPSTKNFTWTPPTTSHWEECGHRHLIAAICNADIIMWHHCLGLRKGIQNYSSPYPVPTNNELLHQQIVTWYSPG